MKEIKNINFERCTSGIDFETWTRDLLRDLHFKAERVGKNDSGVDIITQMKCDGKVFRFYIQCKYYNKPVGKAPIQEIFAGTDIYNEFFWLSREQILSLASGESKSDTVAPAVYDDCIKHAKNGERFVYEKLQTVQLSKDAKFILDFATAILIDTMKYREEFNRKHPEYHINTWDAGWYQIKALAKEYIPDTLKQFNEMYKQFEDRMRPLVYELGFLYE